MILDNEICILNGDLNYRIDTMGRDTVVKAVNADNFSKLLERDQLLVSRRRNPGFRVRAFDEFPIAFAPTYKYDVGSDRYDTSEKRRAPAWCDRILYRGAGKIKQLDYQRHELRISDHRPVSGLFKMRIKKISEKKRAEAWRKSGDRFGKAKEKLAKEAKYVSQSPTIVLGFWYRNSLSLELSISEMFLEFRSQKPCVSCENLVYANVGLFPSTEPLQPQSDGHLHTDMETDVGRRYKMTHYESVVSATRVF